MFLKSVRTKLSNGNCALLYSHQQLLQDQQQDILIVSNVSLVPIFICRKVIYLQRRWVFSCVAKSQLSLDISVVNFKMIISMLELVNLRTFGTSLHKDQKSRMCGNVNKVGYTAGNAWPRHSFPLHNLLSYAYTLYYNFSFFLQIRMPLSREAQNVTSKKALNWVCIVPYKIAPDLRLSFFGTVTITLSIIPMKWALALSPIRRPPINMRRPHIINTIPRGHHLHHQHCHCHRQMRRMPMPVKAVP